MYGFYEKKDIFKETFPSLFFTDWRLPHIIKRKCLMSQLKKIT